MGNCVGHSGRKNGNENVRNANSKQGNIEFKTTLSNKSQETNKEKLSPGITASKSNNETRNQRSERMNRTTFKDTGRVVEPIKEDLANDPVAHQTKNQGILQADKIDTNLETNNERNRQSREKHRTSNTTDSNPKHQGSLTPDTTETNRKNSTQEQSLTERQSEVAKCCDKNDVESTNECLEFNTEMMGEKRSRFLEHTGHEKCSSDSINITDSVKKSSSISTKSFVESEENAGSFEKLVLSACFSENVRKAFVALSEDFINPQENVNNINTGTEMKNEGEALQEESITFTGCMSENEKTDENGHCKEFIDPHKDEQCINSNMDVGTERTDKEQPLQEKLSTFAKRYSQNVGTDINRDSTDIIDPQEKVGKIFATDDNDLVVVKDLSFNGHEMNEESTLTLTDCFSENERTGENRHSKAFIDPAGNVEIPSTKTNDDLDPVKNVTEDEQVLNHESRFPDNKGKNFDPNSTDLKESVESIIFINPIFHFGDATGKHSTGSINIEDSLECLSTTINNEMDMLQDVPDKEQSWIEDSMFTEFCSVREQTSSTNENEVDIVHNAHHKEQSLNEDLVFTGCCSEKGEAGSCNHSTNVIAFENNLNEITSDKDVQDKRQSLNENSNFPEFSSAEKDDTGFSKDTSYLIDLDGSQVSSPSTHENALDMDQAVYDKGRSPGMEDIGFSKDSTDITDLEFNLVSSTTATKNELNIHKDTHNEGQTLNEDPVSNGCFSEIEGVAFTKEGEDIIEVKVNLVKLSITNEDGLDTDKRSPLNTDSEFTECCLESEETGFGMHSMNFSHHQEDLVISSSTKENSLNTDKKFSDKRQPSNEGSAFTICCLKHEGTEMVVITDKDCTHDDIFVIDQETETANKCVLDGDENSAFKECCSGNERSEEEGKNEDMYEIFNLDTQETEAVENNALHKIESSSTRNENELNWDNDVPDKEKHLNGDLAFPGNCSKYKSIEMKETNEDTYGSLNIKQKTKIINECLFDKERDLHKTGSFNSDKENGESLSNSDKENGDSLSNSIKENDDSLSNSVKENGENLSNSEKENDENLSNSDQENEKNDESLSNSDKENDESLSNSDKENDESLSNSDKENDDSLSNSDKENDDSLSNSDKENDENLSNSDKENDESLSSSDKENDESLSNSDKENDDSLSNSDKEKDESLSDSDKENDESLSNSDKENDDSSSNSDKENGESLSDICKDSGLYEIVSLSTGDENEFYLDKDCRNKGLLNEDSAYSGCCLEHEGREMQETNKDINKGSNLDKETVSAHKNLFHFWEESTLCGPGNFKTDQKTEECLPDDCEDSPLYETLSYCKIDKEESCDCFEEMDMDCCCQCCECTGNHD